MDDEQKISRQTNKDPTNQNLDENNNDNNLSSYNDSLAVDDKRTSHLNGNDNSNQNHQSSLTNLFHENPSLKHNNHTPKTATLERGFSKIDYQSIQENKQTHENTPSISLLDSTLNSEYQSFKSKTGQNDGQSESDNNSLNDSKLKTENDFMESIQNHENNSQCFAAIQPTYEKIKSIERQQVLVSSSINNDSFNEIIENNDRSNTFINDNITSVSNQQFSQTNFSLRDSSIHNLTTTTSQSSVIFDENLSNYNAVSQIVNILAIPQQPINNVSTKKRTSSLTLNKIKKILNIDENEFEIMPLRDIFSKLDKSKYEQDDSLLDDLSVSEIKELVSVKYLQNICKIKLNDLARLTVDSKFQPEIDDTNDDEFENSTEKTLKLQSILSQNDFNESKIINKLEEKNECFDLINLNIQSVLNQQKPQTSILTENLMSNSFNNAIHEKSDNFYGNNNQPIQEASNSVKPDQSFKKRTANLNLGKIKNLLRNSIHENEFENLPLKDIFSKLDKSEYEHDDSYISELSVSDIKSIVSHLKHEKVYQMKIVDLDKFVENPDQNFEIDSKNDEDSDNKADYSNNEVAIDTLYMSTTTANYEIINSTTHDDNSTHVSPTNVTATYDRDQSLKNLNVSSIHLNTVKSSIYPHIESKVTQISLKQSTLNTASAQTQSDPFPTSFLTLNALEDLTKNKIKPTEKFEQLNFGYIFSLLPLTYSHENHWIDNFSVSDLKENFTFPNRDLYTMTFNDIIEIIDTPVETYVDRPISSSSTISSKSQKISTDTLNFTQLKDLLEGKVNKSDFENLNLSRLFSKLDKRIYDYQPHWLDEYSLSQLIFETNKINSFKLNLYEDNFESLKRELETIIFVASTGNLQPNDGH